MGQWALPQKSLRKRVWHSWESENLLRRELWPHRWEPVTWLILPWTSQRRVWCAFHFTLREQKGGKNGGIIEMATRVGLSTASFPFLPQSLKFTAIISSNEWESRGHRILSPSHVKFFHASDQKYIIFTVSAWPCWWEPWSPMQKKEVLVNWPGQMTVFVLCYWFILGILARPAKTLLWNKTENVNFHLCACPVALHLSIHLLSVFFEHLPHVLLHALRLLWETGTIKGPALRACRISGCVSACRLKLIYR